jgi:hypothetical protein
MSGAAQVKKTSQMARMWARIAPKLYWIVGLTIVIGVSYIYYNSYNKPVAGTLSCLGGLMTLYYFWIKMFVLYNPRKSWPPYQSTCPDFLTLIPPGSGYGGVSNFSTQEVFNSDNFKCVDFVGVSTNGRLKRADPDRDKLQMQLTDPAYFFPIQRNDFKGKKSALKLRQRLAEYGLSWEAMLKGGSVSIPDPIDNSHANDYDGEAYDPDEVVETYD